jgi:hypothetical protein
VNTQIISIPFCPAQTLPRILFLKVPDEDFGNLVMNSTDESWLA